MSMSDKKSLHSRAATSDLTVPDFVSYWQMTSTAGSCFNVVRRHSSHPSRRIATPYKSSSNYFFIIFVIFWRWENPWWLKNHKKLYKLFGSEPYSGRSSSIKPSCSKTELKRCTTTEIRWNKNEDARTSQISPPILFLLPLVLLMGITRIITIIITTLTLHWQSMISFRAKVSMHPVLRPERMRTHEAYVSVMRVGVVTTTSLPSWSTADHGCSTAVSCSSKFQLLDTSASCQSAADSQSVEWPEQ